MTLQRKEKIAPYELEVRVAEEEQFDLLEVLPEGITLEEISKLADRPKIVVERTSKAMINKFQNTINELERLFFLSKISSLAKASVKYYQRCNKKLKRFMASSFARLLTITVIC